MAVGKCKECGGQVASSAKTCPHCGAKVVKKVGLLGFLFVLLIVLPIAYQIGSGMSEADRRVTGATPASKANPANAGSPGTVPGQAWVESEYVDQMTDEVTRVVSLRSANSTLFEFPYKVNGGSYLTLSFRSKGGSLDAFMVIDKGQMQCGIRDCKFSLRVGDGQVQQWTGLRSTTNESDIMFIRDAEQFQSIVNQGKPLRIGIEFFKAGMRTFEFSPDGYPGL